VRRLLGNLLLSLTAVIVCLAVLEAGARAVEHFRPAPQRAEYLWDWEQRWEGEFYTLASDETGWPPGAEFNGDGMRDRTHAQEKPEGTQRVVFLGDSVTLGHGLEPSEAYPQVLQALLDAEGRRVEVMNVALWGWTARQQRIAWERIARRYHPDRAVLAVCLNDIPEMLNNLARPPRWLSALHQRSALARAVVNARGREIQNVEQLFTDAGSRRVREGFDLYLREVRALRDAVERDGAELAIVVFPFRFQLATDAPKPVAQERLAEFCRAEGLRCLDLLPVLRPAGEAAFLDYDHLSVRGARLTAEALLASEIVPTGRSAASLLASRLTGLPEAARGWLASTEGPAPAALLPALLGALRDTDPLVRASAAWALGRSGLAADDVSRALASALASDADEAVRASAARALGGAGIAGRAHRSTLIEALADARASVRWAAAGALDRIGVAPEQAPSLAKALESQDAYVRAFASWKLGEMGPAAGAAAVPALIEALRSGGGAGRSGAVASLAKLGAAARDAVPVLVEELKSADEGRRWRAARALGRIGPVAAPASSALGLLLRDPAPAVRLQAARALGRIGEGARPAIPALVEALKDADPEVRQEALRALGKIPGR
jgi:HEAT repeat protein/lysophospholipase L1-like esterase